MDVQDKVVVITGASAGIGEATARLLAQNSARCALVARSGEKLTALAAELPGAFPIVADLRDEAAARGVVETACEHFGRIDILINNAGRGLYGTPVEEIDTGELREILNLNVIAPLAAMQAVIPIMRRQGGGLILNVSSTLSREHVPMVGAYAATKYMLNGLTLTARQELLPENIRVILVLPGRTATNFQKNAVHIHRDAKMAEPQGDPVGHVAERILLAIREEPEEQHMHP